MKKTVAANKTYIVTNAQLAQVDSIRQLLYMMSLEPDLPRPLDEQIHVAAYRLYYWLQQFEKTIPLSKMSDPVDGMEDSWPETNDELWESHK